MLNVPNVITLVRLLLVPVMGYFLADEAYEIALPIFLLAGWRVTGWGIGAVLWIGWFAAMFSTTR